MNDEVKRASYALAEKLHSEQNVTAALIAGAVASILAAVAYGLTVATWPFTYGFAAAAIGIVVGLPMGFLGRGIDAKFGVAAALFTFAGCMLGNLFRVVILAVRGTGISPLDVIKSQPFPELAERAGSYVSLIHLVYWLVAVVCAVFLSRRALSREEKFAIGQYDLKK